MTAEQQKLVEENHNLIYSFLRTHKLPIDEFYSVAAMGLCEAAINYDGNISKFSTYAYFYMDCRVKNDLKYRNAQKNIPSNACVSLNTRLFDADGTKELYLEDVIPNGTTMEDDVEAELIFKQFWDGLEDKDRRILKMYNDGKSQRIIGNELGMARNTVCYRMRRMLKDLRKMLEGEE